MTSMPNPQPHSVEPEALLASLSGVLSAHVVTDSGGRIVEIHVLSVPDLHPKQVVRNVESALSAGLGIQIDRRIVSVAQVRTSTDSAGRNGQPLDGAEGVISAGEPALPTFRELDEPTEQRLEFVRYEARRLGDRCTCQVVLRSDRAEVAGHGSGNSTSAGRAEAAARAVLDGIRQARPDLRLTLDGASLSATRGRTFVIVSAHILLDRQPVTLAGAAPLARSPEEAGILAALQATNRWTG
jgi:hypothetical protein